MSAFVALHYQTPRSLTPLLKCDPSLLVISSLHFGDHDGHPYLHLNDTDVDAQTVLWNELQDISKVGVCIHVLLGGAGGAFQLLFHQFDRYYPLLRNMLRKRPFITGINLDVEEEVSMTELCLLIKKIDADFPSLKITMAPVASAMVSDTPGLGGFSYNTLYNSEAGQRIDWFNVQAYGCYSKQTIDAIVQNGYPCSKICIGMLGTEFTNDTFVMDALSEWNAIRTTYPNIRGSSLWEYGDTTVCPFLWTTLMQS